MLAGYYTIASGMMTRQREMDVIGNNLINAQTPGYRADRMVISAFEQELLTRSEDSGRRILGDGVAATSAVVGDEIPLFNLGTIKNTGRDMDMAIGGEGFYNILGADGEVTLTRNGNFDMDEEGYLVLPGYGRVMGTSGGAIQVGQADFVVEKSGNIYSSDGRYIDGLRVTMPAENTTLLKLDNGVYRVVEGAAPQAENYEIAQRSLELSNVDMNLEMTYLVEAQRAFQACSSALQTVDAMNRKAASQIGSIG